MIFNVQYSNKFLKDIKLAKKRKLNMSILHDVIEQLRTGQKLDKKHRDHQLTGDYAGYRECHIQPDWLLFSHHDLNAHAYRNTYQFVLNDLVSYEHGKSVLEKIFSLLRILTSL